MAKYKIVVQPSSNLVNQSEFGRVLEVTPQTVYQYVKEKRVVTKKIGKRLLIVVDKSIDKLNETSKFHGVFRDQRKTRDDFEIPENLEELESVVKESQLDLETKDAEILFKNC